MFPEFFLFSFLFFNLLYCIYVISRFNKIQYSLSYQSLKFPFSNFYSNIYVKNLSLKYFYNSLSHKFLSNFCYCCLLILLFYTLHLFSLLYFNLTGGFLCIFNFFIVDLYSQFSKFFVSLIFLVVLFFFLLFNLNYNSIDFFFLLFCSFVLSLFLMSVFDFITMYFLIEALTFISCFLITCNTTCLFSIENSVKYFLISSVASGLLGFGVTWIYFFTKNTKFLEFIKLIFFCSDFPLFFLAIQLIFISLIIKLGVAPFYFWMPSVYGNLHFLIFFFFITFLKSVYTLFLTRIIFQLFLNFIFFLKFFLSFIIFFSFLIGSVGAIEQRKFQYFFVYASLNQFAFFLLGILCFSLEGLTSSLFFFCQYMINVCFFFFIIFYIQLQRNNKIINLFNLKGLSVFYFFESVLMSIILFSFIGLPPFIGFLAKFNVLVQAASSQLLLEIILALFFNIFSVYYYLNIIKYIWFDSFSGWWLENCIFYKKQSPIHFFFNSKSFINCLEIGNLFDCLPLNIDWLRLYLRKYIKNSFLVNKSIYKDLDCFNSKLNFFFIFWAFFNRTSFYTVFFLKKKTITIHHFFFIFLILGYVFNLSSFWFYNCICYFLNSIVVMSFSYSYENNFIFLNDIGIFFL